MMILLTQEKDVWDHRGIRGTIAIPDTSLFYITPFYLPVQIERREHVKHSNKKERQY